MRSPAFHSVRFIAYCQSSSPPSFPSLFPLFLQRDGCLFLLLHGGSWLGCQDLPAMGAVFIKELAANSGSSWMLQAPNLHFSNAVVNTCKGSSVCTSYLVESYASKKPMNLTMFTPSAPKRLTSKIGPSGDMCLWVHCLCDC